MSDWDTETISRIPALGDKSWVVRHDGIEYRIIKDPSRDRLQPQWYAQRNSDWRVSRRFYSWPEGAFSAILWGRVEWID